MFPFDPWIEVDLHLHFGSAEYGAALALSEGLQVTLVNSGEVHPGGCLDVPLEVLVNG